MFPKRLVGGRRGHLFPRRRRRLIWLPFLGSAIGLGLVKLTGCGVTWGRGGMQKQTLLLFPHCRRRKGASAVSLSHLLITSG